MTTPPSSQQEVTRLLADWSGGDNSALERLIPLVQPELHRLAHTRSAEFGLFLPKSPLFMIIFATTQGSLRS